MKFAQYIKNESISSAIAKSLLHFQTEFNELFLHSINTF